MKTKYYILILILVVMIIGIYFYIKIETNDHIIRKNNDYVPGNIIIGFYDNITEDEANALIFERYGLNWKSQMNSPRGIVGVIEIPKGEEQKWIDILKKEKIIKYAEFDRIYDIRQ